MRGRLLWLFVLVLSPIAAAQAGGWFARTWPDTLRSVESKYPLAKQMNAATLAGKLSGPADAVPLLLDIREPEEYQVSHLPGALLAANADAARTALRGVDRDREIVVYCSVGMRSSAVAEALQSNGFRRVSNLRGGIFSWANEGRSLYSGERRVNAVHSFNRDWGRLLNAKYRSRDR